MSAKKNKFSYKFNFTLNQKKKKRARQNPEQSKLSETH